VTTTTTTNTNIRLFDDDYEALARIHNQVYTDFAQSADEFRFEDQQKPERCRQQRWVTERNGRIVAYGDYHQPASMFDPNKFTIEIGVEPSALLQGIGSALYRTIVDALRPFEPSTISAWCRDDMACFVRFLTNRGFSETTRMWVSILDLATFEPSRFAQYAQVDDGIELTTRAELASRQDLYQKMYDLWCEVREDIPLPPGEKRSDLSFEEWKSWEDHPSTLPEGYFIALAGGEPVGVSSLWRADAPDLLRTGLTGVRRAYRRRGIAFALKLRALEWARRQPGIARVITDNASTNRPMLAINEALGFARQPAWVHYSGQWTVVSASDV